MLFQRLSRSTPASHTSSSSSPPPSAAAPAASASPPLPSRDYADRTPPPQSTPRDRPAPSTADGATGLTYSAGRPLAMSPLALALQAQWRQLQQDLLSPSALRPAHGTAQQLEEDVLQVLRSITSRVDMAVRDATHTVPYLLALGQSPLPSLRTQVVALAALRGVLSSLAGLYGPAAAEAFVQDVFLGDHQALHALSLSAVVALNGFRDAVHPAHDSETHRAHSSDGRRRASAPPSPSSRQHGGHRSLLARHSAASADGLSAAVARARGPATELAERAAFVDATAALRGKVVHATLQLLREVAALCGPVADAMLASDALLKGCISALERMPQAASDGTAGAATLQGAVAESGEEQRETMYAACFRQCRDALALLHALLGTGAARRNEAALVLGSFGAPRALFRLAQRLVYTPLFATAAVRDGAAGAASAAAAGDTAHEAAATMLWDVLKGLGRLTRGSPSTMRLFLSENTAGVAALLVQSLTVSVAEVRESAALWAAALLETQPHAAAELVHALLDDTATAAGLTPVTLSALAEVLRWRGAAMAVYGVSAVLCWRWMLLSDAATVAAVLVRDGGLLATLLELILRGADTAGQRPQQQEATPVPVFMAVRLTALEALHVLTLTHALGSLDTRARLEAQMLRGAMSTATLRRLRHGGHAMLERTEPGYWATFPAMEVRLSGAAAAEDGLSADMRRAGASVVPATATTSQDAHVARRSRAGVAVHITTGAAWRQMVLESLWELTAGADLLSASASGALTAAGPAHPGTLVPSTTAMAPYVTALHPAAGVSASGAFGASPVRVLAAAATGAASASPSTATTTDVDESRARPAPPPLTHPPRTIRELNLLPTRQSATAFRFAVVQAAETLGGLFVQDSMRAVLQLAQHYTTRTAAASWTAAAGADSSASASAISPKLRRAVQASPRGRQQRLLRLQDASDGRSRSASPDASRVGAAPSAIFGTAPRFVDTSARIEKELNPFLPVVKPALARQAELKRRQWGIKELLREDVLLFVVHYAHLMTELPDAIAAVEDHLFYLRRQLQTCPTRDVRRRCVLNDLYLNVYPTLHLFLRYINQQARRSRSVLQLLSTFHGGTIHSGNALDVYDAVGRCTGTEAFA